MPYIKNENNRREELRNGTSAKTAGELNFQIFTHVKYDNYNKDSILKYVKNFLGDKPNYQRYNDMAGVLVLCSNEFQRRFEKPVDHLFEIFNDYIKIIDAYEDEKIKQNGDV